MWRFFSPALLYQMLVLGLKGLIRIWQSVEGEIPIASWTESNLIFISFASESAGFVVVCIAVSSRTSLLENWRIRGGTTCRWVGKLAAAAVLVRPKCLASTPTPDYTTTLGSITHSLKFFRANCTIALFWYAWGLDFWPIYIKQHKSNVWGTFEASL